MEKVLLETVKVGEGGCKGALQYDFRGQIPT